MFARFTNRLFQKNVFNSANGERLIFNKSIFYSNRNKKGSFFCVATLMTSNFNNSGDDKNNLTSTIKKFTNLPAIQHQHVKNFSHLLSKNVIQLKTQSNYRTIVTHEITKNLTLFSETPRNVDIDKKTLKLKEQIERPLTVMFGWMLAPKKNLAKYAKLYTDLGFDVLTVDITPWQLLWPTKGSQVVASDVLKFLENNPLYRPVVLHGFSVGGYVWGEVMVHMAREIDRYKPIIERIHAQIWDSAADITELPIGVPKAIFPRNQTLQKALKNYTIYHMKTFHEQATCHYIRSSQMFHSPLVKVPVLFFLSKNDPIGAENSNLSVKESMEANGMKCTWKCWERSAHVQHYRHHREEYMKYLLNHLETNVMGMLEKTRAKNQ